MSSPVSIVWWRKIFVRYGQYFMILMTVVLVIGFGWNQFGSRPNIPQGENPDKVIMKVNGDPITQHQFARSAQSLREIPAGPTYEMVEGSLLKNLVREAVITQMAKKRNVKVEPGDVDRAIDSMREQAGMKKASDSDWEALLEQKGMSLSDLREQIANSPQTIYPALLQSYKAQVKITDQDAKNQNAEVKLDVILIPSGISRMPTPGRPSPPLTDDQAKAKAESLRAQALAGADFAKLARENSKDFTADKGGVIEFSPEYKGSRAASVMGVFNRGKAFDDAVHQTQTGQITDVVKVTGFQQGYIFAKVLDRKLNTPKDFDLRKALDQLKTEKAQELLAADEEAQTKVAKVVVTDPDIKPYYDSTLIQSPDRPDFSNIMSSQQSLPDPVAQQALQDQVDTEFEGVLKRHPDDATAALIVADAIKKRKMFKMGTTPEQRAAYQQQLITLYVNVLKTTEMRDLRFELADLYVQQKDKTKADQQYAKIAKFLGEDPPYNASSYTEYKGYYDRLAKAFTTIDQPQEAARMQALSAEMAIKGAEATKKEQADEKAKQPALPGNLKLPSGVVVKPGTAPAPVKKR